MFNKIKNLFEARKMLKSVTEANDYHVIKPFLLGCQLENRRFGNYIFIKNSETNKNALQKRNFQDFKETVLKHLSYELNDEIFDVVGDNVQYNKKYNILITMVSEKIWDTLNTAINIAEKTTNDSETQRLITINVFKELVPTK